MIDEAGAPRLPRSGRRPRDPDRLFVQPRRHLDLHDDGGDLRGAGERRPAVARRNSSSILALLLLTSKGAAAVTGGGFITLAATLSAIRRSRSPAWRCCSASIASCPKRARITNLIGNGVATVVIARWDGALDMKRARAVLNGVAETDLVDQAFPAPMQPEPVFVAPTYARSERS